MVFGGGWRRRRGYDPYMDDQYGFTPRRRYRGGGGNSCLRDMFLLEGGCCLAELLGCGAQLVLVAPSLMNHARHTLREDGATGASAFLLSMIERYKRDISPHRRPCCRYSPTCSTYAAEAITTHGAWKGTRLVALRLLRCRPGLPGGIDLVPWRLEMPDKNELDNDEEIPRAPADPNDPPVDPTEPMNPA
jgi:putative membrane protein insertion efficiency factor